MTYVHLIAEKERMIENFTNKKKEVKEKQKVSLNESFIRIEVELKMTVKLIIIIISEREICLLTWPKHHSRMVENQFKNTFLKN